MALTPIGKTHIRMDADGRLLVCTGSSIGPSYTVVGALTQNAILQDQQGDLVNVSVDGALSIQSTEAPDWYGLPQYAVDAAANADDSYFDMMQTTKVCTSCSMYVETNDAIVSFDGGTTDHFFVDVGAGQIFITGLDIPIGATISGKNAVAAADYTNLRVSVW